MLISADISISVIMRVLVHFAKYQSRVNNGRGDFCILNNDPSIIQQRVVKKL